MTESLVSVDAVPRRRVLVIDDEAHHRVLVSELLEGEGFDVLAASDGKEGLRHARDWRPDVILCDLLMPGMSGGDFIRAYRASPPPHAAVLLGTAVGLSARPDIMQLDADRVIDKPFSLDELLALIRHHAHQRAG